MATETFRIERCDTPTGPMLLVSDDFGRLRALDWADHEPRMQRLLQRYHGVALPPFGETRRASAAKRALLAYFEGDLRAIEALPVAMNGTDFQRQVWDALRRIPRGQTLSYGELAKQIGRPAAVARGGARQRREPDSDRRALSPRDRRERFAHWLRRGSAAQALAARARGARPCKAPPARAAR